MDFGVFDYFPYRIYVRDARRQIVYANARAGEFFGCEPVALVRRDYEEVFRDEGFIAHLEKVDKVLFRGLATSFVALKEFNRYYRDERIFKVVDFVCEGKERYIATVLVEVSDAYGESGGVLLPGVGVYEPANRLVRLDAGGEARLTRLENSLLFLLYERKGAVVGYDEIFTALDTENTMNKSSLKALVLRLKKKLGEKSVKNVSMGGYRLNFGEF